tara:strand:- start:396 stop:683 length:288 start_codon:yes stop_codon:yes gene_type:complete
MIHLFVKNILAENHRKYKLAFISSFSIGVLISTITHTYNFIENYKMENLIKRERQLQVKKQEKKCKDENSDYAKFMDLGFPQTAILKFNDCMEEK